MQRSIGTDSGYRHEVPHNASVLDSSHPITKDLDNTFPLTDELYLYEVFEDDIQPLLSSDYTLIGSILPRTSRGDWRDVLQ